MDFVFFSPQAVLLLEIESIESQEDHFLLRCAVCQINGPNGQAYASKAF